MYANVTITVELIVQIEDKNYQPSTEEMDKALSHAIRHGLWYNVTNPKVAYIREE